jgi:hypothetical protein
LVSKRLTATNRHAGEITFNNYSRMICSIFCMIGFWFFSVDQAELVPGDQMSPPGVADAGKEYCGSSRTA